MSDNPSDKPTNPKDICGSSKIPLHLWPTTATVLGALACLNGAGKYGRSNWRSAGVRASIYYDACRRHLDAWFEGEECDPDDGVPHLGAALACIAIIVDAGAAGKLNDDRMVKGGYREFMDKMTPHVNRLKELHKGRDPKHYTIADNKGTSDDYVTCACCWTDVKSEDIVACDVPAHRRSDKPIKVALCPDCANARTAFARAWRAMLEERLAIDSELPDAT